MKNSPFKIMIKLDEGKLDDLDYYLNQELSPSSYRMRSIAWTLDEASVWNSEDETILLYTDFRYGSEILSINCEIYATPINSGAIQVSWAFSGERYINEAPKNATWEETVEIIIDDIIERLNLIGGNQHEN